MILKDPLPFIFFILYLQNLNLIRIYNSSFGVNMKKILVVINITLLSLSLNLFSKINNQPQNKNILESNLSDGWYPNNKEKLNYKIQSLFKKAEKYLDLWVSPNNIKALIVPHAGYEYSGLCAASAYRKLLRGISKNSFINKVIILAPSHFTNFDGILTPDFEVYKSALGEVLLDKEAIETLNGYRVFTQDRAVFENEHSFKMQVPFLQASISKFKIIPLLVGELTNKDMNLACIALNKIIDEKTLIVVTTDLTHYGKAYSYEIFNTNIINNIKQQDSKVLKPIFEESIKQFDNEIKKTKANLCGIKPIRMFLKLIENKVLGNIEPRLSCYYNSAQIDTDSKNNLNFLERLKDKEVKNAVSYASIIFSSEKLKFIKSYYKLTNYEKLELLNLSKEIIINAINQENKISKSLFWPILSPGVLLKRGAFVTLKTKNNSLRGCMGRVVSKEPLFKTVIEMSKAAAFEDRRFDPLSSNELAGLKIEISILSKPILVKSYKDIIVGKQGIILTKDDAFGYTHSALFLPQVATQFGWSKEATLSELSLKAGLDRNAWKSGCQFQVFESFSIEGPS